MKIIAKKLFLSEDVAKLLKDIAKSDRRSMSSLADEALRAALKKKDKKNGR
jgi:predicted transcriptional regulator|tara:strand:- start:4639 stop:4791 length:153 start_codon:yes stop_codon:yes gene_type:complete